VAQDVRKDCVERTMQSCSRLHFSTAARDAAVMELGGGRESFTLSVGELKSKVTSPGRASTASRAATER
jgi:hypothetical protein